MHHLWPTGLLLTLLVSLSGCAWHSVEQAHQTSPLERSAGQAQRRAGQAQCSVIDQIDCSGQSHGKKRPVGTPHISDTAGTHSFSIAKEILNTNSERFVFHSGDGKYESYLVQNIPFEPTNAMRDQIELRYGLSLKHRGEAHITVVTPPEFERLSRHLTIASINALAVKSIQSLPYEIVCLGRGKIPAPDTTMSTFFIVVKSSGLAVLREKIGAVYVQAGGVAPAFLSDYRPHITIGFTHRDLHETDGIDKSATSCVADIAIAKANQ